ncbi:dnaJ homolog subfamily C member 11-like [Arctopsyche grandis]|uniref:dnaJ homolog subfamily C member 11-like n=2 Tax=Arctopsyche grandis TaxID=121162 RepID=UPI00406D8152
MAGDPDQCTLEEDYYTLLNVSKDATNDEINNAYRRLSLTYHPDKHIDPDQKKWAENIFNRVKTAYNVLSDPRQRAIYDTLGTKGLETDGWEVVQRTKTPLEIREEYERLAREREERKLQRSTNPKGSTTVSINATDLFNRYTDEYGIDTQSGLPVLEVSGINTSHSVEAPVTLNDTVTLSCNISTENGTGVGSLNVSNRRTFEHGWAELDFGFGNGPLTSLKIFRTLTKSLFFTGAGGLQFSSHGIHPSFVSNLAYQLDERTVGYLTYKAGSNSSMSTSLLHETENYRVNLTMLCGLPHSYISTTYTRKMIQAEIKILVSIKIGTFGAVGEYGVEKRISQHTNLSGSVTIGVPTGIFLKIKLTRGFQTFIFPIHLCDEVLLAPVFYATVVPLVSWLAVKKFIIDPINREKENREIRKNRENNKAKMEEMRREAIWATKLMHEMYNRVHNEETKNKGLIIIKALYGKLPSGVTQHNVDKEDDGENDSLPDDVIDVTVPVQCLVKNSKLVLQISSKAQLPGFYDTCLGEDKHLSIKYHYIDEIYTCTISDEESLNIPS